MMNIAFPLQISNSGRVTAPTEEEYLYQLVEQVLFTIPGERVNQPEFGSDLMKMVFEPNDNNELAVANQFLIQGAIQKWLGDLIQVETVEVKTEENTLRVTVQYLIRKTQQRTRQQFVNLI